MVQASLVEYATKQLEIGRNIEEIKKYLKEQGYDPREVDSSAQYAHNLKFSPQVAQNQRIEQLAVYVEQQTHAGYQIPQIKQHLISSGYPYFEVDSAINLIQKPKKEEHHVLIAAVVVVLIMGAAILGITLMNLQLFAMQKELPGEKQMLDIKASKLTTAPTPGSTLDFQLDIFNLGAQRRYDIVLEYKIINRDTEEEISGQKETFAIETSSSKIFAIEIPKTTAAGKYLLEIDASYDNITAKAGFIFDVYPAEEVAAITPQLPENVTLPESTQALLEKIANLTAQIPTAPVAPRENVTPAQPLPVPPKVSADAFEGMTRQQRIDLIKRTSLVDPIKAVGQCNLFTYDSSKRDCIIEVAKFKKDSSICGYINETTGKDGCYLQMFIEIPEQTDCSKISSEQLKRSCEMMKQAQEMQKRFATPTIPPTSTP
ncbi:MAG: hypothetical protein KJ574_01265 [Nanoarchaeota archaeon]|nr:hypothetical protein [Nanoarchaeota archaeon]